MAHFAELDNSNTVIRVIVVSNDDCIDGNGKESEEVGIAFCKSLLGDYTQWKQTSYNANFRKNYAGLRYTYDETRDAFIPPKPFDSWSLNEETCMWEPPVPMPDEDLENPVFYAWNEQKQEWENQTP